MPNLALFSNGGKQKPPKILNLPNLCGYAWVSMIPSPPYTDHVIADVEKDIMMSFLERAKFAMTLIDNGVHGWYQDLIFQKVVKIAVFRREYRFLRARIKCSR